MRTIEPMLRSAAWVGYEPFANNLSIGRCKPVLIPNLVLDEMDLKLAGSSPGLTAEGEGLDIELLPNLASRRRSKYSLLHEKRCADQVSFARCVWPINGN